MGTSVQQQNWVVACSKGEPFYFYHSSPQDSNITKVVLDSTDYVFVYQTLHPVIQKVNFDNIAKLASCMRKKRSTKSDHPSWPRIVYTTTHATHFSTKNGEYDGDWAKDHRCSCNSGPVVSERVVSELRALNGLLPVVGTKNFPLELTLGLLHGDKKNMKRKSFDCLHWMMPGMPDLFIKELIEWIVNDTRAKIPH